MFKLQAKVDVLGSRQSKNGVWYSEVLLPAPDGSRLVALVQSEKPLSPGLQSLDLFLVLRSYQGRLYASLRV